jgi:hypothetical protein
VFPVVAKSWGRLGDALKAVGRCGLPLPSYDVCLMYILHTAALAIAFSQYRACVVMCLAFVHCTVS